MNDLLEKQKRVMTLKKEKAALDAEVKELESRVRKKQIENARRSVGLPAEVVKGPRSPETMVHKPTSPTKSEFEECLQIKINSRRTHIMYT